LLRRVCSAHRSGSPVPNLQSARIHCQQHYEHVCARCCCCRCRCCCPAPATWIRVSRSSVRYGWARLFGRLVVQREECEIWPRQHKSPANLEDLIVQPNNDRAPIPHGKVSVDGLDLTPLERLGIGHLIAQLFAAAPGQTPCYQSFVVARQANVTGNKARQTAQILDCTPGAR